MSATAIYLDSNATTMPAPEAVQAAAEMMSRDWYNPSSAHRGGQAARQRVELARRSVAQLVGGVPREIVFTAGATESIAMAVLGTLRAFAGQRRRIVTTPIEHEAVRGACERAAAELGAEVVEAPVGRDGVVVLDELRRLVDETTALVTVHGVNNEVGVVQPVEAVGEACRGVGAVFHCDATQWVGKLPLDVRALPVDLLSLSAHKFHGVKGAGALWARRGVRVTPLIAGTQELGRRGGTENTPGIVAMGVAAELAMSWLADAGARARQGALRERLERGILERVPGAVVNGPGDAAQRVWNTTNIGFPTLEAEAVLLLLSERGVYASAGAACSSGSLDPSPVLLAMGVPEQIAHGSVRFSLSRFTTEAEVDRAIEVVVEAVERLGRGWMG